MRRGRLPDETRCYVLIEERPEGLLFEGGKGVDRTRRNTLSFLEFDLEVVRPVRRKGVSRCGARVLAFASLKISA